MNPLLSVESNELTQPVYDALTRATAEREVHHIIFQTIPHVIGITDDERGALLDSARNRLFALQLST